VDFLSFLESPAEAAETAATVPAVMAARPEAAPAPGEGGAMDKPLARVGGVLELVPLRLEPWGQEGDALIKEATLALVSFSQIPTHTTLILNEYTAKRVARQT